ncbi:hypothetical protein WJ976_09895 [Achromobacter denitrificans]
MDELFRLRELMLIFAVMATSLSLVNHPFSLNRTARSRKIEAASVLISNVPDGRSLAIGTMVAPPETSDALAAPPSSEVPRHSAAITDAVFMLSPFVALPRTLSAFTDPADCASRQWHRLSYRAPGLAKQYVRCRQSDKKKPRPSGRGIFQTGGPISSWPGAARYRQRCPG